MNVCSYAQMQTLWCIPFSLTPTINCKFVLGGYRWDSVVSRHIFSEPHSEFLPGTQLLPPPEGAQVVQYLLPHPSGRDGALGVFLNPRIRPAKDWQPTGVAHLSPYGSSSPSMTLNWMSGNRMGGWTD